MTFTYVFPSLVFFGCLRRFSLKWRLAKTCLGIEGISGHHFPYSTLWVEFFSLWQYLTKAVEVDKFLYLQKVPSHEKHIILGCHWFNVEWNPSRELISAFGERRLSPLGDLPLVKSPLSCHMLLCLCKAKSFINNQLILCLLNAISKVTRVCTSVDMY